MSTLIKPSYIALNGEAIKSPSTLRYSHFNLTKSGRVASGRMTMDIIAKKRKFELSYETIFETDFDKIMAVIDGNAPFFNFSYDQHGTRKSAVVYAGSPSYERYRTHLGWYYKSFAFDLIEQ